TRRRPRSSTAACAAKGSGQLSPSAMLRSGTEGGDMDYKLFDADNHYYESEDAFTRYGDAEVQRFVHWVSEGKKRHLLFGNVMQTMAPNPTFNPITKPGAFHTRLK